MYANITESPENLNLQLEQFMTEHVYPNEARYHEELAGLEDRFVTMSVVEELKAKAKEQGLWNLFVPEKFGGLSNAHYAPLAEIMGRVYWSAEVFNCNAPDTGNMEVFMKYGTEEQKKQWLEPLLSGDIRSSFAMTEPDVASSDATNVQTSIMRDGSEYVINGKNGLLLAQ